MASFFSTIRQTKTFVGVTKSDTTWKCRHAVLRALGVTLSLALASTGLQDRPAQATPPANSSFPDAAPIGFPGAIRATDRGDVGNGVWFTFTTPGPVTDPAIATRVQLLSTVGPKDVTLWSAPNVQLIGTNVQLNAGRQYWIKVRSVTGPTNPIGPPPPPVEGTGSFTLRVGSTDLADDFDDDGIADVNDNCPRDPNGPQNLGPSETDDQTDSPPFGIGNACRAGAVDPQPPANDQFLGAAQLGLSMNPLSQNYGVQVLGAQLGEASAESPTAEPDLGPTVNHTLWYRFLSPVSGSATVTAKDSISNRDLGVRGYVSSDPNPSGWNGLSDFDPADGVVAGLTYWLVVYDNDQPNAPDYFGDVDVSVSLVGGPPVDPPILVSSDLRIITTVAGDGTSGLGTDGAALTNPVAFPTGLAIKGSDVYIGEYLNSRIRKLSSGGLATIDVPGANLITSLAIDSTGNLLVADHLGHRILRIDLANTSNISTLASGVDVGQPAGLAVDGQGNIYWADYTGNRVQRRDAVGNITTVAGAGQAGFGGDGGLATAALLNRPAGVAVNAGVLYIADGENHRIRRVVNGTITTLTTRITQPNRLTFDTTGHLLVADVAGNRVVRVSNPAGTNATYEVIVGTGAAPFAGDGGLATQAQIDRPQDLVVAANGDLYVTDHGNHRIRKVSETVIADTTPPTVTLAAASSDVTAEGPDDLTATATDDVGVTRVEFSEGATLLSVDTATPYKHSLMFTAADNGAHVYTAKAFDGAGNNTTSTPFSITVNIAPPSGVLEGRVEFRALNEQVITAVRLGDAFQAVIYAINSGPIGSGSLATVASVGTVNATPAGRVDQTAAQDTPNATPLAAANEREIRRIRYAATFSGEVRVSQALQALDVNNQNAQLTATATAAIPIGCGTDGTAPCPVPPCSVYWIGASGAWDVATNWKPAVVPGPDDNVCITQTTATTPSALADTYTVTLTGAPTATVTVHSFTLGGVTGNQTLAIERGATSDPSDPAATLSLNGTTGAPSNSTIGTRGTVSIVRASIRGTGAMVNNGTFVANRGLTGPDVSFTNTSAGLIQANGDNLGVGFYQEGTVDNSGLVIVGNPGYYYAASFVHRAGSISMPASYSFNTRSFQWINGSIIGGSVLTGLLDDRGTGSGKIRAGIVRGTVSLGQIVETFGITIIDTPVINNGTIETADTAIQGSGNLINNGNFTVTNQQDDFTSRHIDIPFVNNGMFSLSPGYLKLTDFVQSNSGHLHVEVNGVPSRVELIQGRLPFVNPSLIFDVSDVAKVQLGGELRVDTINGPLAPGSVIPVFGAPTTGTFATYAFGSSAYTPQYVGGALNLIAVGAPTATIVSGPTGPVKTTSATFAYAASPATPTPTFACKLDSGVFSACPVSGVSYSGLSDGPHIFQVKASNVAGTGNVAEARWNVDTAAPTISVVSPADQAVYTIGQAVTASYTCADIGSGITACTGSLSSGTAIDTSAIASAKTFTVNATDNVGNTFAKTVTYSVVAPIDTIIDSGPSGFVRSTSATFSYHATPTITPAATFDCKLDNAATFSPCPSTGNTYSNLSQGGHTLQVRATNSTGTDATPATRTWTVDTIAPTVTITVSPNPVDLGGNPQLQQQIGETGSGINSATLSCTPFDVTTAGTKTVTCTVADNAGNSGTGSTTYVVSSPVINQADVGIVLTSAPVRVNNGQNFIYTLTIRNYGPAAATNVRVNGLFIGLSNLVSVTPTAVRNGSLLQWSLGTLAPGAQTTLRVQVPNRLPAIAIATATTPDPRPGNNLATGS
jgi:sugar lactone lactonase YvrE